MCYISKGPLCRWIWLPRDIIADKVSPRVCFHVSSGNFIDTSNNYQFGQSEAWIGEWMQKRGNREQMGRLEAPKCVPFCICLSI